VISVDTKKKELVGNFKASGWEWQPKGSPEKVNVHDFADPQLGKVIPYGVYDLAANAGWVNVGIDHDTAEFVVESIRRWWVHLGQERYPVAKKLLITADCGGSNGSRTRLWKVALQQFADEVQLPIHVCRFPRERASGTRLSTVSFALSPRIGAAVRCSPAPRSSI
jgi:hypothetical protein